MRKSSHFGGIFAPLTQYPGANYGHLWAQKKYDTPFAPKKPASPINPQTIFVRTRAPMQSVPMHNFRSALLLVEVGSASNLDKQALREAGIEQIHTVSSGVQAVHILLDQLPHEQTITDDSLAQPHRATPCIDVLFCYARCEDMSASAFVELIRLHPTLGKLPIILLAKNQAEAELLQTMEADFQGLIVRPYTIESLQKQIYIFGHNTVLPANNATEADFMTSLLRYENAQNSDGKAEFHFQEALRQLQEKSFDTAISSFKKTLYHGQYKGEAEVGLAAAYRSKNELAAYRYYMHEATLTFIRAGKWDKAKIAFEKLVPLMPSAAQIFVHRAQHLIRAQNYELAAQTLLAAPNFADFVQLKSTTLGIAKACLYTENPPFTVEQVIKAFTDASLKPIVSSLRQSLGKAQEQYDTSMRSKREARQKQKEKALRIQKKAVPSMENTAKIHALSESLPGEPSLLNDVVKKSKKEIEKKSPENTAIIAPLQEHEADTKALAAFPKLQEMASVIKVTLKLMK